MMTTNEMKTTLFKKLQDEQTYFKKSDISIKKVKDKYKIVIADYEHIIFTMSFYYDEDYNEYTIMISEDDELIIFTDSKKDYNIEDALIELGYHIGNTF